MRYLFVLLALLSCAFDASAGPLRNRRQVRYVESSAGAPSCNQATDQTPVMLDALAEVNAARARHGLPAFILDEGLARGAMECAKARAAALWWKHAANDYAALPPGVMAASTGAGAGEPSWGWLTCCTYESYTYAGAAYVWGRDGKRYMSLFVR